MSEASMEALLKRLDALLSLLVEWNPVTGAERPAAEQSVRLARAGLDAREIAKLTGRHPNNIHRDLSNARKKNLLPKTSA